MKFWSGWSEKQVRILQQHAPKFINGCVVIETQMGQLPSLMYQERVFERVRIEKGRGFWSEHSQGWGKTVEEVGYLLGKGIFDSVMVDLAMRELMKGERKS